MLNYLRGSIEEVDAEAKGFANSGIGVVFGDGTEDVAQRGSAEADAAELEAGFSKVSEL